MARVSISEAARLASVSRPTIYKLLKSGKLSYTSAVKHGKTIKTIDTAELMRVFGAIEVVSVGKSDAVKFDDSSTSVKQLIFTVFTASGNAFTGGECWA
ncbi:helix-turn-helix domain-containing protein (plasmid) [Escherichia coli]